MAKAKPAQERLTLAGLNARFDSEMETNRSVIEHLASQIDERSKELESVKVKISEQQQLAAVIVKDVSKLTYDLGCLSESAKSLRLDIDEIADNKSTDAAIESVSTAVESLSRQVNVALGRMQNLENTLEKFGGEHGLIAQALEKADEAKEMARPKWQSWILPLLAVLALGGFMLFQRGCDHENKPTPAPDENERSILDDQTAKAKKLTGDVIFLHDRDPLSRADAKLLEDAAAFKLENDKFQYRSLDCFDDKNETIKKLLDQAAAKGIDPPVMVHKSDGGKITYAPMAKTWAEVVKVFGK